MQDVRGRLLHPNPGGAASMPIRQLLSRLQGHSMCGRNVPGHTGPDHVQRLLNGDVPGFARCGHWLNR